MGSKIVRLGLMVWATACSSIPDRSPSAIWENLRLVVLHSDISQSQRCSETLYRKGPAGSPEIVGFRFFSLGNSEYRTELSDQRALKEMRRRGFLDDAELAFYLKSAKSPNLDFTDFQLFDGGPEDLKNLRSLIRLTRGQRSVLVMRQTTRPEVETKKTSLPWREQFPEFSKAHPRMDRESEWELGRALGEKKFPFNLDLPLYLAISMIRMEKQMFKLNSQEDWIYVHSITDAHTQHYQSKWGFVALENSSQLGSRDKILRARLRDLEVYFQKTGQKFIDLIRSAQ